MVCFWPILYLVWLGPPALQWLEQVTKRLVWFILRLKSLAVGKCTVYTSELLVCVETASFTEPGMISGFGKCLPKCGRSALLLYRQIDLRRIKLSWVYVAVCKTRLRTALLNEIKCVVGLGYWLCYLLWPVFIALLAWAFLGAKGVIQIIMFCNPWWIFFFPNSFQGIALSIRPWVRFSQSFPIPLGHWRMQGLQDHEERTQGVVTLRISDGRA